MLLQAGADVNEMAADTELGTEALYHASEFADIACLKLLLDARPHPSRVSYCLDETWTLIFLKARWRIWNTEPIQTIEWLGWPTVHTYKKRSCSGAMSE